jgi:hypothetical protein
MHVSVANPMGFSASLINAAFSMGLHPSLTYAAGPLPFEVYDSYNRLTRGLPFFRLTYATTPVSYFYAFLLVIRQALKGRYMLA